MRTVFLFGLIALLCVAAEDHVVVLDLDNFDSVVSQGDIVVEFYAPWCGHCKKLAPEYEKAAELLKEEASPIKLAKCDVDNKANKPLAEKYGIKGFPSIRLFRNGSLEDPEEYKGPRTAEGLVHEVKKAFGPASQLIATKEQGAELAKNEAVMIGAFGQESEESEVYIKTAEKLRSEGFVIGHTFNPKLLEPCTADPSFCTGALVFMLKAAEKNISKFEGAFEVDELYKWAIKESTPRLVELIQSSPRHMKRVQDIFTKPEPRLIAYVASDYKELDDFKKVLIEVGDAEESFNVIFIDASINSKAARFFGLEEGDYPAIVMHDHSNSKKYIEKKTKAEDIKSFVAKFKAGELEPTVKSEEPPKDDDSPVKVVVGKTFAEVLSSGKDVLLEFYAPWCGHCKKLEPIYTDLGKHFKSNSDVIIAKIDATANDIPDSRFELKGYPTVKYIKKDGEIMEYEGERTLAALIAFVEKTLGISQEDPKAVEEEPETQEAETKEEL